MSAPLFFAAALQRFSLLAAQLLFFSISPCAMADSASSFSVNPSSAAPLDAQLENRSQAQLDAALFDAANSRQDRTAEIQRLLAAGANARATRSLPSPYGGDSSLGISGITPLMTAAKEGKAQVVEALLPFSDPLAADSSGRTALMRSVEARENGAFLALLAVSDVDAVDRDGKTVLYLAALLGCFDMVRALLPHADARIHNERGSPLSAAVSRGHSECALALIPFSDPHIRNTLGATPFLTAVAMQSGSLIGSLAAVSDVSAVDSFGKSAADVLAKDRRPEDIEAFAPYALDEQVEFLSRAIHRSQLRGSCGPTPILSARALALAERRALVKTMAKSARPKKGAKTSALSPPMGPVPGAPDATRADDGSSTSGATPLASPFRRAPRFL